MDKKDPAFLFYSKDFYEGTRTMLPEERACYIDLMIYQHQHGFIPTDLKRICLYCNGISEETVKAVLEAKFKLCLEGWYNETMQKVIDERKNFSNHQSVNGTVGQFFKKAKAILQKKDYLQLRDLLNDKTNEDVFSIIKGKEINEAMLKAMLVAKLKHLEDEDVDKDSLFLKEYSFLDIKYIGAFRKWIEYKTAKKQKYANQASAKIAYEKLVTLSSNSPDKAMAIVEQSMGNGWAGLFEFKGKVETTHAPRKYDFAKIYPNENFSENTLNVLTGRYDDYFNATGKQLADAKVDLQLILDLPTPKLIKFINDTNTRL